MSPNTSRWMEFSLCQSVITGTMPESAVNSAMPSPSPIASDEA